MKINIFILSFIFIIILSTLTYAIPIENGAVQISAGGFHSLALKADGSVWAWGRNDCGQLGDGSTTSKTTPVQVFGISHVMMIAAGLDHSIAIKVDGSVWAWGRNDYGQLGDGSTTNKTTPVQVSGLSNVTNIAAGFFHNLAIKADCSVWAWGLNSVCGRLGDGSNTSKSKPVQVLGLSHVELIATGQDHSLAIKDDGSVWAWGCNSYGKLGDGSATSKSSPVQVPDISDVKLIATGDNHSLAIKDDGSVWAWGRNDYGQLGDGSITNKSTPVQIPGLSHISMISAGNSHSLAIKSDGSIWAWGSNIFGQLGDGSRTNIISPAQMTGLLHVSLISAGNSHSLAVKANGSVWAWGSNYSGQLGNGGKTNIITPMQVPALINVSRIAAGYRNSLAIKADCSVWAWGSNYSDQLGCGITSPSPFLVPGLSNISMISSGYSFSLAIKDDGSVWAWGYNVYGQLGDGCTTNKSSPVQVSGITHATMIAAGFYHGLAIKDDGSVWAWGRNDIGQLGDGSTANKSSPVQVSGISHVVMIAAGKSHSLALKDDGSVWAWGRNDIGQLGDGSTANKSSPVQVSGISYVVMIAAGESHSLALKDDGSVWAWGYNHYGQLGDGSIRDKSSPVQIPGFSHVKIIAAGAHHSLTIKDDGSVWGWGRNDLGQLGDGSTTNKESPVQVTGLSDVAMIAGSHHSLAIKNDGSVWAFGDNKSYQLGYGNTYLPEPVFSAIQFISKTMTTPANNTISVSVKNTDQKNITFSYNTIDETALAGIDYLSTSGILSFQAGETQKDIHITILNNSDSQNDKTFLLNLEASDDIFLNDGAQTIITILSSQVVNSPYAQTFSQYMPATGWTYYSSSPNGRIQETTERLRMDSDTDQVVNLNEAILNIDLSSAENIHLNFFQKSIASDICTSLPETYTDHCNGDGVSISNDGHTWFCIIKSEDLLTDNLGKNYAIDISTVEDEIQANCDESFNVNGLVQIKFQQYGNRNYPLGGREWDDIVISLTAVPPVLTNLLNDPNPIKSKSWNWSSNSTCTFRFAIDQNPTWQPTGNFTDTQAATKSNTDGIWYLHVQAKDTRGNLSEVHTVSALLDNTKPTIELSNNLNQWQWSTNETSTFRFAIDKNPTWEASGNFTSTTSTTLYQDEGIWYLHVQAKDRAGNMSDIQSRTVILEKPTVQFAQGSSKASEENTSIQLELALSRIVETDIIVQFALESSQALLDTDFILPNSLYVTIQAGQANGFIPFTVIDDSLTENIEDITFKLLQSTPVELGWKQTHTYQIIDNDYPGISISQYDYPIIIVEDSAAEMLTLVLDTQPESRVDILFDCEKIDIRPRKLSFLPTEWNHQKSIQMLVEDDNYFQGILDTALIFKVSSSDAYYQDYPIPNIDIQIVDNDPEPIPPEVSGPNNPLNDTSPKWIWVSGGGSNTFRYKVDDANLDRGATETTNTWFQPTSELTQGFHTLYVQEFNEYTNQWSDSGAFTIQIDTGLPCSSIASISSINTVRKQLTITYLYDDIYWGEICDKANSGSGIEKIELWVSEPNTNHYEKMLTDTVLDGQFTYTVSQEGKYKFYLRGMDKANNYETNSLPDPNQLWDAETFYSDNFSGYAIIVVGSVSGQEGLESHTLTANNIYKQLIHRNFWPEHIKYFNPFDETQPGETDFDEHGGTYADAVENVITQWAPEQIQKLSGPLFIILIDHGSPDIFHLTGTQSLTAYHFNQYLQIPDNLENKEEIVIILGTCFSGSFIDEISAKGRIIVTSAAANEPSYRGPKINPGGVRDGGFFITHLFIELTKGNNLLNSFNTAVLRTEIFTLSTNKRMEAPFFDLALQHPLLDDNGKDGSNSLPLNGDGYIAQNIVLGHNENQAVEILQTTIAPQQLKADENTLSVGVDVHNIDNVKRVWIEIRKPGLNIEDMRLKHPYDNIGLQQSVEMEELDLAFNPQKDTYTLVSDSFDIPGQYIIFFYVKDKEGITSGYKETVIYKSKENNDSPLSFFPISPMNNESSEFSDVILEWESTSDPESDIISYSVILSTDTDTIIKERIYETMSFISLPKSWDKKEVLWKVQAIDAYGNITETPEWTFKIDNNQDSWGSIVYFNVYDMDTQMPVPHAKVNVLSNDMNLDLLMNANGLYIKRFDQSGVYHVAVSEENYTPVNNESIEIIPGEIQSFTFNLDFISRLGDINRNGKCDIGDAVQSLQVLSGIDNISYYDPFALTGDVIELRDAIFVLQQLSEIEQ
jgi:alpha-tubulin suppressor-like RCC1 family protein